MIMVVILYSFLRATLTTHKEEVEEEERRGPARRLLFLYMHLSLCLLLILMGDGGGSGGSSRDVMLSIVNFCTAQIVGDTERPKAIDGSNPRRLCRFLLAIISIMGLTAIVTLSLLNQPQKRSQRVWIKQDLHNATGYFDRMAMKLNSADWRCPCNAADVVTADPRNKARIVEFFLINATNPQRIAHLNSIEEFCSEVSSSEYFVGFNATCQKLLRESFQLSGWDWDFIMGSTNLYMDSVKMRRLNPIAFMFDVCTSWTGGLSQATSFFLMSHIRMNEHEAGMLNTFLRAIRITLDTCSRGRSWPPPDNAAYSAEAKKYSYSRHDGFEYIMAMSFNWTQYVSVCAPSYCEHLVTNSAVWIAFNTLSQVGGFVSVTLFALRTVIWPLISMLIGWSTCFETCQGKENETEDSKMIK